MDTNNMKFENRRLFVGGIPDHKTKQQIWVELINAGMENVVDVIVYRAYSDKNRNRGFVFVEFSTHKDAVIAKAVHAESMHMFGQQVHVDWSTPLPEVDDYLMKKVKKLFIRNLNVLQTTLELRAIVVNVLGVQDALEKVYKQRDYAFLHFKTRQAAERSMSLLKAHYANTGVEVTWAKPPRAEAETDNINANTFANENLTTTHCCQHSAAAAINEERRRRTTSFSSMSSIPSLSVSPVSSGMSNSQQALEAPGPSRSQINYDTIIDNNKPILMDEIVSALIEEMNKLK